MRIDRRIRREFRLRKVTSKGYSRKMAALWVKKSRADLRKYKNKYDLKTIKEIHKRGYLCKNINKYNLLGSKENEYITDFDYSFLYPYNSSFGKWFEDMLTTQRVLKDQQKHLRNIYFSIIQRNGRQLKLKQGEETREYKYDDIIALIREKGVVSLRPAHWLSQRKVHKIEAVEKKFKINGVPATYDKIVSLISGLSANYVITDYVPLLHKFDNLGSMELLLKFWLANDTSEGTKILYSEAYKYDYPKGKRKTTIMHVDLDEGTFLYKDLPVQIENWQYMKSEILKMSKSVEQINFFTVNVGLVEGGEFIYRSFSADPKLPELPFLGELNDYLKEKARIKKANQHITLSDRFNAIKNALFIKRVQKRKRKGIRPYMQKLWNQAVKDDFWHTKGVSLRKKIWAWKRGFQSFRIKQYGLTEENYKNFLSDYDYFWLNRLNNSYQIWINDKTTFRYSMEKYKEYVPRYFFSIFKRDGSFVVSKMWDCPEGVSEGIDGLFEMLEKEKKLAMKPSAETHGDGFCCLEYEDGKYFANGEEKTREEIIEKINGFRSFYVVTEYIYMHDEIKKIYDKSVNTVRVMVINKHGYDPKIMQTYMRIGSSRTGYTDNVGYGGICAMIDIETGELYNPEGLKDHEYFPQPIHPDSGTPISGKVPNWDLVCQKVLEICQSMPELEYLGFDIAITNDGFRVIEINIHQDLHKVAEHSEEIREYFRDRIRRKSAAYGCKM